MAREQIVSKDGVVRHLRPYVQSVARRCAANPADAEEIAQDSLLALVRGVDRFAGRCALRTWAYAVVRSQASHRFRRSRPLPISALARVAGDVTDPRDYAEEWHARHDLERALSLLSHIDRVILLERDLEGQPAERVARDVGMSVAAMKSRLHRARTTMRARLIVTTRG